MFTQSYTNVNNSVSHRVEHSLRLIGPLKVNATPNLAVRVGKTQSAYVTMNLGVERHLMDVHTMSTPRATQTSKSFDTMSVSGNQNRKTRGEISPSAKPTPIEYRGPEESPSQVRKYDAWS